MRKLHKYFWELILHSIALVIMSLLIVNLMQHNSGYLTLNYWYGIPRYYSSQVIGSPIFQHAGYWAIRFLLLSLAMSPIYHYFGWKPALRLRKPAGLWAFAFAALHVWLFIGDITWGKSWIQSYTRLGLVAFVILAMLTLTSNRAAMRLLGKNWKRLHRLVYVAGILVILHGLLAASHWNKFQTATLNVWEMRLYCILMVMLLLVRLPMVKTWLKRMPRKRKRQPEYANGTI